MGANVRIKELLAAAACACSLGCAGAPPPAPLTQADAVAASPSSKEAAELAPQAHALAEQLRAEAVSLHEAGRNDEAAVVAEQASVAYERAFAIARATRAELRLQKARGVLATASKRIEVLEERQAVAQADADALELRARVALETEPVVDVTTLSAERAQARRAAAWQLTSEARSLCLATQMLVPDTKTLAPAQEEVELLHSQLSMGSVQKDLFPRASKARAACLKELTEVRRPATKKAPEAGLSDRLLTALTETNQLFAFRDDRGVVVNLLDPVDAQGALTAKAAPILQLLGKISVSNARFPLLVVVHTAKKGQEKAAEKTATAVVAALRQAGADEPRVQHAGAAEPLVDRRVPRAEEQNARVEIVFVTPTP